MLLSRIQDQAVAILSAAAALRIAGVSIHKVDKADAAALYAESLALAGTSVGVLPPTARFRPDSDGPVTEDGGITLRVNVSEPVELGRAQGVPPVTELAETVGALLHSQNWPDRSDAVPLGLREILIVPDEELLVIQVALAATGALDPADTAE